MHEKTRNRTVIFLDIDGVLQPGEAQHRFRHDLEELRRRLASQFGDQAYLELDRYDLGAIYYDWDRPAVERLRGLCADFGAEIVVSSAWRSRKSIRVLQAYFRLHDLHHYVTDVTGEEVGPPHFRAAEVRAYLDAHPEVERFVIIDDDYQSCFNELFPHQFVNPRFRLTEADERRARQILSGGPAHEERRGG